MEATTATDTIQTGQVVRKGEIIVVRTTNGGGGRYTVATSFTHNLPGLGSIELTEPSGGTLHLSTHRIADIRFARFARFARLAPPGDFEITHGQGVLYTPPTVTATCSCGAAMAYRLATDNTWVWADQHGRTAVSGAEGELITGWPNGQAWAHRIANAYMTKTRQPLIPDKTLIDALMIRANETMYPCQRHIHTHDGPPPTDRGPVPWCCDMPMMSRPTGWECRGPMP